MIAEKANDMLYGRLHLYYFTIEIFRMADNLKITAIDSLLRFSQQMDADMCQNFSESNYPELFEILKACGDFEYSKLLKGINSAALRYRLENTFYPSSRDTRQQFTVFNGTFSDPSSKYDGIVLRLDFVEAADECSAKLLFECL